MGVKVSRLLSMLQLHPLTLAFAFNLLFLNVSTSPTKSKPSPTKDTPSKILSSSEWFSIESMEEKGNDYVDESEEGDDKDIEIAEKENPSADAKTKASQEELKNGKVDQSEGKPVVEDGKGKIQEENTSRPKEEKNVKEELQVTVEVNGHSSGSAGGEGMKVPLAN